MMGLFLAIESGSGQGVSERLRQGQYHLVHFVNFLAGGIKGTLCRTCLREWVVETCGEVGISPLPDTSKTEDATGFQDNSLNYLLIELSNRPGFFMATAWIAESEQKPKKVFDEKLGDSLDQLPDFLAKILAHDAVWTADRHCQTMILELIIPVEYFNKELEKRKPRGSMMPIGIQYPVVVRPLERFSEKKWRPRWSDHWKTHRHTILEPAQAPHVAEIKSKKSKSYSEFFRNGQWIFVLKFPPDEWRFQDLLESGVGIMLWPRKNSRKFADMKNEISQETISNLPSWLRQTRNEEWDRTKGTRRESITPLSLLWDDPLRLPDVDKPHVDHSTPRRTRESS